jgi:hypothetical protein
LVIEGDWMEGSGRWQGQLDVPCTNSGVICD